jgi:hypothetical protein
VGYSMMGDDGPSVYIAQEPEGYPGLKRTREPSGARREGGACGLCRLAGVGCRVGPSLTHGTIDREALVDDNASSPSENAPGIVTRARGIHAEQSVGVTMSRHAAAHQQRAEERQRPAPLTAA